MNNLTLITGMIVSTKFLQTQESLPLIYLALQRQGQQTTSCVSVMIVSLLPAFEDAHFCT